jgi:methyl-accepting chemotaxis protein/methyl-accepting chemotaxis protein-1 (serine sensor receptor)
MNGLGIRGKMMLCVGSLAAGYLIFFLLIQWTSTATEKHLGTVAKSVYPAAFSIEHAQAAFLKMNKDYNDAVLMQDAKALAAANEDAGRVSTELAAANEKMAFDPALQAQIAQAMSKATSLLSRSQTVYTPMVENPNFSADALASMASLAAEKKEVGQMMVGLSESIGKKAFQAQLDAVSASNSRQRELAFVLFLVAAGFGIGAIVVIEKQVSGPLRDLATRLADGAAQVNMSALEVSSSGLSLAEGASQQAASLEETSASSQQISAMAQRSSQDCKSTSELVAMSQQKFSDTNRSMLELVQAMNEISASSDKVIKIIKTIDGIAFQTNILALNAAVEAARAGESGLGFAVVAEEVRNLAQRCAQAAQDTASIVDESIQRSNHGKAKLNEVSAQIHAVTSESVKVKELVEQITIASDEQTRGIGQIARAIAHMEKVTQASAGSSEESAAAAQDLKSQSNLLNEIVSSLSFVVEGIQGAGHRSR